MIDASDWVALSAVIVALVSAVISYVALRSQVDPEVVVYATADFRRPSFIILVIENLGKGIARNISFQANREIPSEAFGFDDAKKPKAMTTGPLVHGIPVLHPGERRRITWGQFGGIQKGLDGKVLHIRAAYYSGSTWRVLRHKHTTLSTIDMRSLEATDASDGNWDKKAAQELERIARSLEGVTGLGSRALRVTVRKGK